MGTRETRGSDRIVAAFVAARAAGRLTLVPYVVAGYPDVDGSHAAALALIDAGADVLEVGLPYSDPVADGVTLQRASAAALRGGQTLDRSIELVERIAAARPHVPLIAMGYANQLLGADDGMTLLDRLGRAGASGVIVADLTPDEGAPVEASARAAGLALVYLVAPTSTPGRRASIAERTGGFLYCVSMAGITGARRSLPASAARLVRGMLPASPLPVAVGFGVSRPVHLRALAKAGAHGAVVASALVDSLGPDGRDLGALDALMRSLRAAC